jgi:hypothetical protein
VEKKHIDSPMEPLIKAKEAAEYLGHAPLTVTRMAHRGQLPSIAFPMKNGKFRHLFRVSDLKLYVASLERRPVYPEAPPPPEALAVRAG